MMAWFMSLGDIQFPNLPSTPGRDDGTVSFFEFVLMNVLLSTRATSAGFVIAHQLKIKQNHYFCIVKIIFYSVKIPLVDVNINKIIRKVTYHIIVYYKVNFFHTFFLILFDFFILMFVKDQSVKEVCKSFNNDFYCRAFVN